MTDDFNQIFEQISNAFENMPQRQGDYIESAVREYISQNISIAGIPEGPLTQSIVVKWDGQKLTLGILQYGYFLSFGVAGTKGQKTIYSLSNNLWGLSGSRGDSFGFKRINKSPYANSPNLGISAKPFLPDRDMVNQFIADFIEKAKALDSK